MLELCKSLRDDLSIGVVSLPLYAPPFGRPIPYVVLFAAAEAAHLDTTSPHQAKGVGDVALVAGCRGVS